MASGRRLIVFAKPARLGKVKTRLIPPLTPDQALSLHLALLGDVIDVAREVLETGVELRVGGGGGDVADMQGRFPGLTVASQGDGDLGERLAAAFGDVFGQGAEAAAIVGSDHPTLPSAYVDSAFGHLEHSDAVFGPSSDGGYYLVGLRESAWPAASAIFSDVPWSGPDVLETGLERALEARLTVALLPEWYDIDRPEDLERLAADARPGSSAGRLLAEWDLVS